MTPRSPRASKPRTGAAGGGLERLERMEAALATAPSSAGRKGAGGRGRGMHARLSAGGVHKMREFLVGLLVLVVASVYLFGVRMRACLSRTARRAISFSRIVPWESISVVE